MKRRRLLALASCAVLVEATQARANTVTLTVPSAEWDFSQDDKGNLSFVSLNTTTVTLDVFGNIPVTANNTFAPSNWSDLSSWSAAATFGQTIPATEAIYNVATGVKTFDPFTLNTGLNQVSQLWQAEGPTESTPTFSIPLPLGQVSKALDDAITSAHLSLSFSVAAPVRYDATIASGVSMTIDQQNVTVQSLVVQAGGALSGNSSMIVRGDFTNHGYFAGAAGLVQGDFYNDADPTLGRGVLIAGQLTVRGQLYNTGEIKIPGSGSLISLSSVTNGGTIKLSGGTLAPAAVFVNAGDFQFSAGSVGGPGTTINSGTFQWTGGAISGAGGLLNVSSSFTISGTNAKRIGDGGSGTLTNAGLITHAGGAELTFGGFQLTYMNGPLTPATLNNLAGGVYDLQGDSNFSTGFTP